DGRLLLSRRARTALTDCGVVAGDACRATPMVRPRAVGCVRGLARCARDDGDALKTIPGRRVETWQATRPGIARKAGRSIRAPIMSIGKDRRARSRWCRPQTATSSRTTRTTTRWIPFGTA